MPCYAKFSQIALVGLSHAPIPDRTLEIPMGGNPLHVLYRTLKEEGFTMGTGGASAVVEEVPAPRRKLTDAIAVELVLIAYQGAVDRRDKRAAESLHRLLVDCPPDTVRQIATDLGL